MQFCAGRFKISQLEGKAPCIAESCRYLESLESVGSKDIVEASPAS
jgi:hypothetical protein